MYKLQFNPNEKTPKYKQIVQSIIADIERAVLKKMSNYLRLAS
jgi:DNA-binding transcriptional regulator YhcF (GntR family)